MADADIPKFKNYAEGEPIPPVDPEDIKRMRPRVRTEGEGWSWKQDMKAKLSPGADYTAVSSRCDMIATMYIYKLLAPWQRDEGFDDAVFRVAATLPLRMLEHKNYMVSGDEQFGFDPNTFVQRLVDETGVPYVWEPIATRVPEGTRMFTFSSNSGDGSKREAKRQVRELVWTIWKRFSALFSHSNKELPADIVATFFADFLIDNMDLVRQLEDGFMGSQYIPSEPILSELERRAQQWSI